VLQSQRQNVVVPIVSGQSREVLSVDALLSHVQSVVSATRKQHPELSTYHLHDVLLRVEEGELRAILEFRK
jgi:hypothetical protein